MFIAFLLQIYIYIYIHYLLINVMIIRLIKRLIYFSLQWTPEVGPQHLFWELFTSASIPSSWSGSPPMSRTRSRTNQSCSRSRLAMSSLCLLSSSSLPFVVDYARSVLNLTVFFEWQVENIESLFFCNTLIYKLTIFSWI